MKKSKKLLVKEDQVRIMPRKRHLSIRTLLLTVFLSIMIFPMLVVTLLTYQKQNKVYQDQVSQYMLETVRQTNRALDANMSEIDRMSWPLLYTDSLHFLDLIDSKQADLYEANDRFREEVYLNMFRGRMHQIQSIYLVTPDYLVFSSDHQYSSLGQIDLGHFNHIVHNIQDQPLRLHWFDKRYSIVDRKEGFNTPVQTSLTAVRVMLNSNTSKVRGYLFIHLNNLFLEDVLKGIRIGRTGQIFLVGPDHELIYAPASDGRAADIPIAAILPKLSNRAQGTETVDRTWLVSYDESKASGWRTVAVVPIGELLKPNQEILRNLLLILLLGAAASVFVSLSLVYVITDPIVRLSKSMKRASFGNLNVREDVGGTREILSLQNNFNAMMETIQDLLTDNEKQQKEKREALIRALQTQIHPHFLYNTLDTIYWMSKKAKAEDISQMVIHLGKFFRLSLNSGGEWTTLEQEFDHIRAYMEIQSVRYRDKLKYSLEWSEGLASAITVPLLLQPLVENALEHGISKKAKPERPGLIEVKAVLRDDVVVVSVTDNGMGMTAETVAEVAGRLREPISGSRHIGLRNVHQRLTAAFGPEYGVGIASTPGEGTTVTISFPYRGAAS